MSFHTTLGFGFLATLACLSDGFCQATQVAAFDVNSGASETQPGFQGLASAVSGSQNGITLTTTPDFNGSTGYRDRGTGGALATAAQPALMRDLCFFNSTSPDLTTVTFTLTGLEASRQYEINHFMYNQGAFQRQATFYETSASGPLLGSYATPGNTPDQGGYTFTITANASGQATYVVVGDDPNGSSVIFNGMTVGLLPVTAPPQPLEFTAISFDGTNEEITLTWKSNMQGHGRNETGVGGAAGALGSLRYQVNNDPLNYGQLVDQEENWISRDDVKVWWRDSDLGSARTIKKGNLEPVFGVDSARFGPEYGFGWVLDEFYGEPVLLLKTTWGARVSTLISVHRVRWLPAVAP